MSFSCDSECVNSAGTCFLLVACAVHRLHTISLLVHDAVTLFTPPWSRLLAPGVFKPSCSTPFTLFLRLVSVYRPFQLYFIPKTLHNTSIFSSLLTAYAKLEEKLKVGNGESRWECWSETKIKKIRIYFILFICFKCSFLSPCVRDFFLSQFYAL